jgi:hypothetical protein
MNVSDTLVVQLQPVMGKMIIREITGEVITICPKSKVREFLGYLLAERN